MIVPLVEIYVVEIFCPNPTLYPPVVVVFVVIVLTLANLLSGFVEYVTSTALSPIPPSTPIMLPVADDAVANSVVLVWNLVVIV